ncbi:MAG: hypothetical protein CMM78_12070 [Rhodospirillaceae bacterium]|nr:hypothetical protein [Rhodospirillales bacterium]MAX48938.1 hypothetical protein [Rhodospirillaceae bacterium]
MLQIVCVIFRGKKCAHFRDGVRNKPPGIAKITGNLLPRLGFMIARYPIGKALNILNAQMPQSRYDQSRVQASAKRNENWAPIDGACKLFQNGKRGPG